MRASLVTIAPFAVIAPWFDSALVLALRDRMSTRLHDRLGRSLMRASLMTVAPFAVVTSWFDSALAWALRDRMRTASMAFFAICATRFLIFCVTDVRLVQKYTERICFVEEL